MMANEQALAEVGKWIAKIKNIEAGLELLINLKTEIVKGTNGYPLKLDLSGGALTGYSTYKEYLTNEVRVREIEIVEAAISRANYDLKTAVAQVQSWSAKL